MVLISWHGPGESTDSGGPMPFTEKTIGIFFKEQAARYADRCFMTYPDRDLRFTWRSARTPYHPPSRDTFSEVLLYLP